MNRQFRKFQSPKSTGQLRNVLIFKSGHPQNQLAHKGLKQASTAKRRSLKVSRKQTSHLDDAGVLPGLGDRLGLFLHHRLDLACIRSTVAVLGSQVGDRTDEIPIRRYYHSSRRASAPGRVRLWGKKARSLTPFTGGFSCASPEHNDGGVHPCAQADCRCCCRLNVLPARRVGSAWICNV